MATLSVCPAKLRISHQQILSFTENGGMERSCRFKAETSRAHRGAPLTCTLRRQALSSSSSSSRGELLYLGCLLSQKVSKQSGGSMYGVQRRPCSIVCMAKAKERTPPTADASPLVKLAWYGSEAFGQVVGIFRGGAKEEAEEEDEFGPVISRQVAMEALKKDYDKSYFVTGNMSMGIYEDDCEFADPFVSFRGRKRFKQNVSNLGSFMEEVNLKVLDWKEEEDKVTTKWRFSCVLGLPWRPILAASGGTDHYFDKETGKIYKHVERWDISPADGVRQLFKPNPKSRQKSS